MKLIRRRLAAVLDAIPCPRRLFLPAVLLIPMTATALTFQEVELECPIGGEKFKTNLAASGSIFGTYLDFRPFGAIATPFPLARCPGNGFVMFKESFTPDELKTLEAFVASPAYQGLRPETNYYLASRLLAVLDAPPQQIAQALVRASWEATDADKERRYREEALSEFDKLTRDESRLEKWIYDQLLAGELERRLGQFDRAAARFNAILEAPNTPTKIQARIARFQLSLIAKQDTKSHLMSSMPD